MAPPGRTANDNVRVMVRVRPFNKKEIDEVGGIPVCTVRAHSENVLSCINPATEEEHNFPFDYVFWSMPADQVAAAVPFATQESVFEQVGVPSLDSCFDGYNGCIFAYGQTSSGKTHSMMGYAGHGRGVTPRLCEQVFERIRESEEASANLTHTEGTVRKIKHTVELAFLEIYNEKVLDLLQKDKKKGHADDKALKITNDPHKGPIVMGLTVSEVSSWQEIEAALDRGQEHRSVAATAMNDRSSRSHAVVQLTINMEETVGKVGVKDIRKQRRSRVNLVDLAGSEKVGKSKVEGANLKEAIGINQSLTCLGRVIDHLIDSKPHIPYRDSVLTQLLADSLGGNSRTTMLAALSPAAINYEETLSTLRYASRARKIVNKVKVNEDPAAALIRELQEELGKMKENIMSGNLDALQQELFADADAKGLPRPQLPVQAMVAERAAETEQLIAQLQSRAAEDDALIQQREEEWEYEREEAAARHEAQLKEVQEEHEALLMEKEQLEGQKDELEKDLRAQRRKQVLKRFNFAAKLAAQSKKHDQTKNLQKDLRREMILTRFKAAAASTRAQEETAKVEKQWRDIASALEQQLQDSRDEINQLRSQVDDAREVIANIPPRVEYIQPDILEDDFCPICMRECAEQGYRFAKWKVGPRGENIPVDMDEQQQVHRTIADRPACQANHNHATRAPPTTATPRSVSAEQEQSMIASEMEETFVAPTTFTAQTIAVPRTKQAPTITQVTIPPRAIEDASATVPAASYGGYSTVSVAPTYFSSIASRPLASTFVAPSFARHSAVSAVPSAYGYGTTPSFARHSAVSAVPSAYGHGTVAAHPYGYAPRPVYY